MAGQTDENRLHVLRHAAFTARDVREMERPLLENGVPLMRMASAATAHVVAEMIEDEGVALEESNIVLLAGSGGLILADYLAFSQVYLLMAGSLLVGVVTTHRHHDHIGALAEVVAAFPV